MNYEALILEAKRLSKNSFIYKKASTNDETCGYWINEYDHPVKLIFSYQEEMWGLYSIEICKVAFEREESLITDLDIDIDYDDAIRLTKEKIVSYPSLDYLFYFGGEDIQNWLKENSWKRDWGWNNNFKDKVADEYNAWWQENFPIYSREELYAFEGGWPMTWPDDDVPLMYDKRNEFIICSLKDPEPWYEIYRINGEYRGFCRNT